MLQNKACALLQVPSVVHIRTSMPLTGSGKVLKTALRAHYAAAAPAVCALPQATADEDLAGVGRQVAALLSTTATLLLGDGALAACTHAKGVALVTSGECCVSDVRHSSAFYAFVP